MCLYMRNGSCQQALLYVYIFTRGCSTSVKRHEFSSSPFSLQAVRVRTTANKSVAVDSPAGRARRTCLRGRGMAWHQWGTWADNGFASCAVRLVLNATARAHVGSRSLLVQVRDACVGCSCQQRLWLCSVTCRSPRDIGSSPRARGPHQGKVPKGKEWNGAPKNSFSTQRVCAARFFCGQQVCWNFKSLCSKARHSAARHSGCMHAFCI